MAKAKSPNGSTKTTTKSRTSGKSVSNAPETSPITQAAPVAVATAPPQTVETPRQKKTDVAPLPSAFADLEAAIRQRAYQIYLERRGAPGNPHEDWARAEHEVLESFQNHQSA